MGEEAIVKILTNGGAFGILAWLMVRFVSKTLPDILSTIKDMNASSLAALKEMHTEDVAFRKWLSEEHRSERDANFVRAHEIAGVVNDLALTIHTRLPLPGDKESK